MSIADKITRLQTAKSGIASAITAKGGTVGASDGFEEFASDIASIPSGGSSFNPLLYANTGAKLFDSAVFTEETVHIVFGAKAKDFGSCFINAIGNKLIFEFAGQPTSFGDCFRQNNKEKNGFNEITIIGDTSQVQNWTRFLYNYAKPQKLYGELDLSGATSVTNAFWLGTRLTDIQFKPNTIPISIDIKGGILDDNSLVSIANGIDESKTGQAISFTDNDYKERISALLGMVSMDATNTYHVFTLNPAGTVNLEVFITDTKGWTIA